MSVNWDDVCAKLPTARTPEEKAKRKELWEQIDVQNNSMLSLAEVDKGVRDILNIDTIFDAKPVIIRAFNKAKSLGNKAGVKSMGDDYVTFKEFRMLLVYLAVYLRIYEVFTAADESGDRRLTKEEFMTVYPKLQSWLPGKSPDVLFAECNGEGNLILFTEFAEYFVNAVLENDNPEDE